MRLDQYLTINNIYKSRSQASLAIKNEEVFINGKLAYKAGQEVNENDTIKIVNKAYNFVSRGGYKLLGGLENFKIDVSGLVCLDIGASTGGFTDCLLQHNAQKVYAYDVGHDQLDQSLKEDKRVVCKEKINCRELNKSDFNDNIDLIVMDVSFISCTKMFEAISNILLDNAIAIILFKPQFEVGSAYLNGQGIVKNDKITLEKLNETIKIASNFSLELIDKMLSPISGGDGNKEYLLYFKKVSK